MKIYRESKASASGLDPEAVHALAAAGVPIAESLVMSWGGWKQNARGRETFRESYLGPVPDSTAAGVSETLPLPEL